MQHSHFNSHARPEPEQWVERLCITDSADDRHLLASIIESINASDIDRHAHDHPCSLWVAETLSSMKVDQATILATLYSDIRIQDSYPLERISEECSESVSNLSKNVRWLQSFKPPVNEESLDDIQQAERLRRMLLSMIDDVRAVLIIIAWRLQRLRDLNTIDNEKNVPLAKETMDIFAPLANRLGLSQIKWEMEDRSFHCLQPQAYKKIARSLEDRRIERETYITDFTRELSNILAEEGVKAEISGRPKHIYSIWKKMQRKQLNADQLYDLHAVRVIVDDVRQCYEVLGLTHMYWKHVPEELDDYINAANL